QLKAEIAKQVAARDKEAAAVAELRMLFLQRGFCYTAANNLALLRGEAEAHPDSPRCHELYIHADRLEYEYRRLRAEAEQKAHKERTRLLNAGVTNEAAADIEGLYVEMYALPDGALKAEQKVEGSYLNATYDTSVTATHRR